MADRSDAPLDAVACPMPADGLGHGRDAPTRELGADASAALPQFAALAVSAVVVAWLGARTFRYQ